MVIVSKKCLFSKSKLNFLHRNFLFWCIFFETSPVVKRGEIQTTLTNRSRVSLNEATLEFLIYACLSFKTMLSQYLSEQHFTALEIGIIMAVYPLVSLISCSFWLKTSEELGNKKTYIMISSGAALMIWGIFFSEGLIRTIIATAITSFFISANVPVAEKFVSESLIMKNQRFDRVRFFGTVGFAITSFISGLLIKSSFSYLFIITSAVLIISLPVAAKIDYDFSGKGKTSNFSLRDGNWKTFLFLLTVSYIEITLITFNSTFFPVLSENMGFDKSYVGIIFSVMALSELVFLYFGEGILKKFAIVKITAIAVFLTGVRLIVIAFLKSEISLLICQLLHSVNYIVVYLGILTYINQKLPRQMVVKALSLYWMVNTGFSQITGSLLGGALIDKIGMSRSYILMGIVGVFASIAIYGFILHTTNKNNQRFLKRARNFK